MLFIAALIGIEASAVDVAKVFPSILCATYTDPALNTLTEAGSVRGAE
jgi:hypothetical protein